MADSLVWPSILELVGCLQSEFGDDGFCFIGPIHGNATPMDYGDSGMAWVRLSSGFPYDVFPEAAPSDGCVARFGFQLEVGVARCAPMPDDYGNLPSVADQEQFASDCTADMSRMLNAIRCCFGAGGQVRFRDVSLISYTPLGPDGGVGGGVWDVAVSGD